MGNIGPTRREVLDTQRPPRRPLRLAMAVAALVAVSACEPAPGPGGTTSSTATSTSTSVTSSSTPSSAAQPTGISGVIWLDTDQDGIREPGEPPIAGASVMIDGWVSAPTDADGTYSFANLEALTGEPVVGKGVAFAVNSETWVDSTLYYLGQYRFSPEGIGPEATDSDVSQNGGYALIEAGAQTIDVGVAEQHGSGSFSSGSTTGSVSSHGGTTVSGRAWNDLDGDGVRENGEPPLPGVKIWDNGWVFSDCCGNPDGITGADGTYTFGPETHTTPLETQGGMGTGYLIFVEPPAAPAGQKWVATVPDAGGNDTLDSDAYVMTPGYTWYQFVLEYGTQTRDVGLRLVAQ